MTTPAPPSYAGYRFPMEIISHAVWLYFHFPLSLRHVDEILAARGIVVSHETVRPMRPTTRKTLSCYLIKIARLGGYFARGSDLPPGNIVMWRGLARLRDIEVGANTSARCG